MGQFFIRTQAAYSKDLKYFELSVTESVDVSLSNMVTSAPVETREMISDHVVRNNKMVQIRGKLTKYSSAPLTSQDPDADKAPKMTIQEFIMALEAVADAGEPVTVYYDNGLPPKKNCVLTMVNFAKFSGYGDTYDVNISLEQVRVTGRGKVIAQERFVNNTALESVKGDKFTVSRNLKDALKAGNASTTYSQTGVEPSNAPYLVEDAQVTGQGPALKKVYGNQPPAPNKIPFPLRRPDTEWQPKS